jgi:branched-subunit amino acid ABC-type transport system permease component
LDALAQYALNGLINGALLALPAIGLTAIFAVLRFANFAVASHATIGAFAGFVANVQFGLPAPAALAVAFLAAGAVGVIIYEVALKPFRPFGALTVAIASIAVTIIIENFIRFGFGNELRGYALPLYRDWQFGGLRIGPQQVQNLTLAVVAMTLLFLGLAFTRTGKMMRAVADNPTLANLKGINPDVVARLTNFVAMGFAGMGGMLLGLDTSIDPLTGFRAILPVFAAVVVGGLGSIPGAVVGALLVGVAEEVSLIALPPAYKTGIGFIAILLVLTFRPGGLLGARTA